MKGASSSAGHGRFPARAIFTLIISKIILLKLDKPNEVTKPRLCMKIFIC
jgi:hypothetical protein